MDSENLNKQKISDEEDGNGNFLLSIVWGLVTMIICSLLWATITVLTKYQITFMAIVVGAAIGIVVQKNGGTGVKYGILGSVLALFSCIIGNLISYVCLFANEYDDYSYLEAFANLDTSTAVSVMIQNFHILDLFFYVISIYIAFVFSMKNNADKTENSKPEIT